ncbi:hypothetical protein [Brevibacillus panacihumi]|uniref:hypothetical protein n=1 Tax=Brevibacillus panacihumi TaxID=497735 RepID=UPI003D1CD1A0
MDIVERTIQICKNGDLTHDYVIDLAKRLEAALAVLDRVKLEVDEFTALLEISFETHPSVAEKAAVFNDYVRKAKSYREALEQVNVIEQWTHECFKAQFIPANVLHAIEKQKRALYKR